MTPARCTFDRKQLTRYDIARFLCHSHIHQTKVLYGVIDNGSKLQGSLHDYVTCLVMRILRGNIHPKRLSHIVNMVPTLM